MMRVYHSLALLLLLCSFQVNGLAWKPAFLAGAHQKKVHHAGMIPLEMNGARLVCGDNPPSTDILLGSPPDGLTCDGASIAADPNACEKYVTCYFLADNCWWQCHVQNGQQLLFDTTFNGCNFPSATDCGSRPLPGGTTAAATTTARTTTEAASTTTRASATTTTTQSSRTTTKPSGGFECPPENGFYPLNSEACIPDYYDCVGGVPYPDSCPGTSLFDPDLRVCVPANECTAGVFVCPQPDGFFANPNAICTSSFYTCTQNVAYPSECPGSSVFDPVNHNCIPKGTGNCA